MKKYRKFIKQIISESELPRNTKFKGYVINLPKSDQYLAGVDNRKPDHYLSYQWATTPELAIVFKDYNRASKILIEYDRPQAILCLIFDIGKQLAVLPEYDVIENLGLERIK